MKKKWTLSDKEFNFVFDEMRLVSESPKDELEKSWGRYFKTEDVKEFIRRLKELLCKTACLDYVEIQKKPQFDRMMKMIDTLAGEEFYEKKEKKDYF